MENGATFTMATLDEAMELKYASNILKFSVGLYQLEVLIKRYNAELFNGSV